MSAFVGRDMAALRQTLEYAKTLQRVTTNNISRYFAKAGPMRTLLEQNKICFLKERRDFIPWLNRGNL